MSSRDAGRWRRAAALGRPCDHEQTVDTIAASLTPAALVFFAVNTVFNTLCEIFYSLL